MAVLYTLRTNKILKGLTFFIIGVGMYLFVDPQFDAFKTFGMVFSGKQSQLELNSLGTSHGYQLFNTYERPNSRGGGLFISEPEDIAVQAHLTYLEFIQQSQNTVNSNKRNLNTIWDHFSQRSFIKKEMQSLEYNYSPAEKIDLVKGTITGIGNAAPFFNSWWKALRTDDEGAVDENIDGKVLEDSISVWMENSKVNQNQANYLNYNFMYKPFQISNNEITRFMSLYEMGTFAPKLFLENEYIDANKSLNGQYIYFPFRDIKDSEIEITEEEILEYYNSNLENYKNENKRRVIDYYYFEAKPSVDDINKAKNQILTQIENNKNKFESLILDTANSYQELLNFVRQKSVIKNIVSIEKQSLESISKYDKTASNKLGGNYFGPIVDEEIVKIGIVLQQDLDSMQVVFLNKDIYLDDSTTDKNFRKAKDFAFSNKTPEEFEENAKKIKNVLIKKNVSISILDTEISGIEGNSREIIRWIYGIPSNINTALPYSSVELENRNEANVKRFTANIYDDVVVFIKELKDGDYKDFEEAKAEIKKKIIDNKKSKLIKETFSTNWSDDIDQISKNINKKVNLATNFSFASANFPVGGNDPGATGFFFGLKENEISKPYVGNRGVFVFLKTKNLTSEISDSEILSTKQQVLNRVNADFKLNVLKQSKSNKHIDMRHMSF